MESINQNIVLQRMAGWAINELQQSLGISSTMRLKVDTDNYKFWNRAGDGIFVYPHGQASQSRTEAPLEVTFFWETETITIWVNDLSTLIAQRRYKDFDYDDFPEIEPGVMEVEIPFGDAKERIEIWKSLPPKPKPDGPGGNDPPTVVGKI